jgi:hypothetical protein
VKLAVATGVYLEDEKLNGLPNQLEKYSIYTPLLSPPQNKT